jgi:transketolase
MTSTAPTPAAARPAAADDLSRLEDVGFLTCMTLTLMGNYSQTGHFGGPLAYTPYNVAVHLAGPERGGLRYDYRHPKHPFSDKFLLAGGHCINTCYSLWMLMGEAMARRHAATGDKRYIVDRKTGMRGIDALGFRRGAGALATLLKDAGLEGDPLFADAKLRGIRSLSGHAESTDLTNDVNGGPSGVGIATAAGKAAFWDIIGAPIDGGPKVIAFEGEFAMTEGHAQELKTQALALKVGKRLRVMISSNNAGIDDSLLGGVIDNKYVELYDLEEQWRSYGWNVLSLGDGHSYAQVIETLTAMERWDASDRRPLVVVGNTTKGYWPAASNGKLIADNADHITGYKSHPYGFKMNSPYFLSLASTFEKHYGVTFAGIRDGAPKTERDRLVQFKTNIDVVMSVLESTGTGAWLADRLVGIGETLTDPQVRIAIDRDPFQDERLRVAKLPLEPQKVSVTNDASGATKDVSIALFKKAGEAAGARRAISEIFKWLNYVTENRMLTLAADLSESINLEHGNLWGHYDPETNPRGTRIKAAIQEAGNVSTAIGMVSQSASLDPAKFAGVWAISGTYGAFTPLMYTPARIWSQQNQDSPFRVGVLHILVGHSGPETAADGRSHFGIFAPQVWKLFPRTQTIHLNFWDYNDVAPGYFAAAEIAARDPKVGLITLEVARPDFPVADRTTFADTDIRAAAKGFYTIRDFAPGKPKQGYVVVQGSSATNNLVRALPELEAAGVNVRVVSAISEELFDLQPASYRDSVLPPEAMCDLMVVSTGTRRVWPLKNVGPLTDEYSMTSDWDHQWLTGGLEPDVIAEAHLDSPSIVSGIKRFAGDREKRIARQQAMLAR